MKKNLALMCLLLLSCLTIQAQTATVTPPIVTPSPAAATTTATADAEPASNVVRPSTGAAETPGAITLPPEKSQPLAIPRFAETPVIDGQLNEAVWKNAAVLKNFYQIQPGDNIAPSKQTEVLMGYDSKFLYIGFRAFDDPNKVVATVARRDNVFEDDYVRILLDTYNDRRRAYVFVFNPLGVQADGIFTEGRGEDYSFDAVMASKGVLTDYGYSVEVAIPFKSLRYEAGKDKVWGVHVFRNIKHFNNEVSSWMPIARDASGTLNQEGRIIGLEGISKERTLELIPSMTLSENGRRVRALTPADLAASPSEQGRLVNEPMKFDPGLTAKFSVSSTVTLDLALNPDFAQIEADVPVVTANQRFPIFFAEKRPFFLEGIDIFQTPLTPVHTRAIIDPDIAVKLTGKQGHNTYGLLLASDNGPGSFTGDERLVPGNFRFLDKNAYIGVARFRRNIGTESSLGIIATTYNFIEKHNNVGGFDGRFRFNGQTTLDFQVLGTTSRRYFFDPLLGDNIYRTGNGLGYSFTYNNQGRRFGYTLSGVGRTRDYRADVGFTLRNNTNQQRLNVHYNSEPNAKAKLVSYYVANIATANYDFQGRSQEMKNETQLILNFRRQGYIQTAYVQGYERLVEEEFGPIRTATREGTFAGNDPERSSREKTVYAFGGITPNKKYSLFFLGLHQRGALDLDFGAGRRFPRVSPGALLDSNAALDPGPGNLTRFEVNVVYQPIPAWRNSFNYTKSKLVRNDTGRVAFDDNIFILRSTYQFTRFTFARARIDYTTLASRVRAQFLLGWAPNPGTSFYVGYNDDLKLNSFSPFTGELEPGFRRNGRTFFIKMSYLFRRSLK